MQRFLGLVLGFAWPLTLGSVRAEPAATGVAMYALVVGSNAGGTGQLALRYAEDDARRVAATLAELGGYPADAIDVVVRPTPDALRAHLDRLAARVADDRAAGRQARVVFYYSGHARSTALDLGPDELALGELRQRLFAIPATLMVVVLDACQSGAFSQVKGAEPAADFSFNLRQHLDASGVAVLASSSGAELSQESEQLRSSYFTHHLLVGLRGAGDLDRDGQVSIDEAYRYAYQQTLLATAQTAVGGQHPSLEFDLKGHGNVPLSFPRAASASIELPGALEGQTLIEDRRARTVVAETYKARGAPVRIAVAPGEYSVLVRQGNRLARCEVQVGPGGAVVDLDRCTSEMAAVATSKGAPHEPVRTRFELTGVYGNELSTDETKLRAALGDHRSGHARGVGLSAMRGLGRRWWLGGFAALTRSPDWNSTMFDLELNSRTPVRYRWTTLTVGAVGRAAQPFSAHGFWARCAGYAQLGAGLGIVLTETLSMPGGSFEQHYVGWSAIAGAGIQVDDDNGVGFSLGYEFDYARVLEGFNDTNATGGHRLSAGVSYSF
ncbi:MAG TPA: caspase family protein [Kofleriaceae bacterium]